MRLGVGGPWFGCYLAILVLEVCVLVMHSGAKFARSALKPSIRSLVEGCLSGSV